MYYIQSTLLTLRMLQISQEMRRMCEQLEYGVDSSTASNLRRIDEEMNEKERLLRWVNYIPAPGALLGTLTPDKRLSANYMGCIVFPVMKEITPSLPITPL